MRFSPIIAVLGALPLTGCALLHSNVKGGFACSAPHGTCAPSTTIDDAAIHAIDAQAGTKDAALATDAAASDADMADADLTMPPDKATATPKEKKAWTFIGPVRPVLKIVYLPWLDAAGRLHPRTSGFVPIDAPHIAEESSAPLDANALRAGSAMSLLALAEMAPDIALMEASAKAPPSIVQAPGPTPVPVPAKQATSGTPATPAAGDPVATIKAQVKEILNQPKPAPDTRPAPATLPPTGN